MDAAVVYGAVVYNEMLNEFGARVRNSRYDYFWLTVCPFCGSRLPSNFESWCRRHPERVRDFGAIVLSPYTKRRRDMLVDDDVGSGNDPDDAVAKLERAVLSDLNPIRDAIRDLYDCKVSFTPELMADPDRPLPSGGVPTVTVPLADLGEMLGAEGVVTGKIRRALCWIDVGSNVESVACEVVIQRRYRVKAKR